jgi:hypothetical protein
MSRLMMVACAMAVLFGPNISAWAEDKKDADDPLKKDGQALQGKWERVMTTDTTLLGKAKRAVKEIDGDKETVTWYGDKDQVIRSHRVTFKLAESGNVRTFTYSDMEILEGPGKGTKVDVSGSYVYRIAGDEFCEASGFLQNSRAYFEFDKWKKVKEK